MKEIDYNHCIGVIDLETTGFMNNNGKIVEVGIVALDLRNGDLFDVFDSVCHEKPITREEVEKSWIVSNGYMTTEEIRLSPALNNLRPEIQAALDKFKLGMTAYNIKFDFDFMESRGFIMPFKLQCPMKLSVNICKIPSRQSSYSNAKNRYKWPKAEEAYDFFFGDSEGEPYSHLHRGLSDARSEARIVYELYKLGSFRVNYTGLDNG